MGDLLYKEETQQQIRPHSQLWLQTTPNFRRQFNHLKKSAFLSIRVIQTKKGSI